MLGCMRCVHRKLPCIRCVVEWLSSENIDLGGMGGLARIPMVTPSVPSGTPSCTLWQGQSGKIGFRPEAEEAYASHTRRLLES